MVHHEERGLLRNPTLEAAHCDFLVSVVVSKHDIIIKKSPRIGENVIEQLTVLKESTRKHKKAIGSKVEIESSTEECTVKLDSTEFHFVRLISTTMNILITIIK